MSPDAAAAICRRAATGIRMLCGKTTGVDWHMEIWPSDTHPEIEQAVVCSGTDTAVAQCGDSDDPHRRGNAAYITRMRPAVGRMIANTLDQAALLYEAGPPAGAIAPILDSALYTAQAFLQEYPARQPVMAGLMAELVAQ
jgi:hypothetical protein